MIGHHVVHKPEDGASAIIDTGTSLIAVPSNVAEEINNQIGTFKLPLPLPGFDRLRVFRCGKTLPRLTMRMGGIDFTLDGDEYAVPLGILGMCISAFQGLDLPKPMWVVGDVFLRKYYSIYDYGKDGKARVGLALSV